MKRNFNQKKGITLIALVVTIIVLLLLAGVSISMLTGQNSVLKKAGQAKEKTDQSQLEEEIKLGLTETNIEKNVQGTETDIEEYLKKIDNAQVEKKQPDAWYVTKGNASATVYKNGDIMQGKVDIWDGNSSSAPAIENGNWQIRTAAELKFFADFVNNANQLTDSQKSEIASKGYSENDYVIDDNTVVNLLADIDLGARQSDGVKTYGTEWIPIGPTTDEKFTGTFDGNNHTIRGVFVKQTSKFAGIFGNSDTIKNLKIADSYIYSSDSCVGGIVGALREGTLENCENINTTIVSEEHAVGGIAGQFTGIKIENCSNSGKIVGNKHRVGGIVGQAKGIIEYCTNSANIIGERQSIGGIVGYLNEGTIKICNNSGRIEGGQSATQKNSEAGGIVGLLGKNGQVDECTNTGIIYGKGNSVGGIVGIGYSQSKIKNSINRGKIEGDMAGIGGIVGVINTGSQVNNCSNTGNVTNLKEDEEGCYTGGIVGLMSQSNNVANSTVEFCYNSGNIKGYTQTGGIIGLIGGSQGQGTVRKCYSKGKIIGEKWIGAIAGLEYDQTNSYNVIENLYYLNTVGIKAITVKSTEPPIDIEEKNVKSTTDDITSYEQFIEWIKEK